MESGLVTSCNVYTRDGASRRISLTTSVCSLLDFVQVKLQFVPGNFEMLFIVEYRETSLSGRFIVRTGADAALVFLSGLMISSACLVPHSVFVCQISTILSFVWHLFHHLNTYIVFVCGHH